MALLKALCWALIFIIRIRFSPGTSPATVLNNIINIKLSFSYFLLSSAKAKKVEISKFMLGKHNSYKWKRCKKYISQLHSNPANCYLHRLEI